ncbi:hypothetical protein PAQ31011_05129 [Pandoraea aquatica]|uniref:Uncharacterized protein n=1 Tax=Pandoraea aquatica TaxID=2508290 RepID=A0A5E4Z8G5_9BURK|nr:hypothetical protein PAQ31011_05129 [Pandoraea aquatica]
MSGKDKFDWTQQLTRKRNAERRIPTHADFVAYDGHHCHALYKSLPPDWRCPGCCRSTFEVLRWTMRFPHLPTKFLGWAGGYHRHHDHAGDRRGGRLLWNSPYARFPETVLCEQCNAADATVKRVLKLPKEFSYSPEEIRAFVEPVPHGWHIINYQQAARIYEWVRRCPPTVIPGTHA